MSSASVALDLATEWSHERTIVPLHEGIPVAFVGARAAPQAALVLKRFGYRNGSLVAVLRLCSRYKEPALMEISSLTLRTLKPGGFYRASDTSIADGFLTKIVSLSFYRSSSQKC